jgi:GNAT superfamily N-acetyltransferase
MGFKIYRALEAQVEVAYNLVLEYYAVANVQVREDREQCLAFYFTNGAGVWLANAADGIAGCVALRSLPNIPGCGEIKRMYVRPPYRGRGISDLLLQALEEYAREFGYQWLYLDTPADMKAAARFYRRKGFAECERYNQNPQAAIFMKKRITVRSVPD